MNIVPTLPTDGPSTVREYSRLENHTAFTRKASDVPGLRWIYDLGGIHYQDSAIAPCGPGYGGREFSAHDQRIVEKHLREIMGRKDKIVILEIGVHRCSYDESSTGVFLKLKRDGDIYLGVDIESKTFLDDASKNVHTLQSRSEAIAVVTAKLRDIGADHIDVFMIDGYHSVAQVYAEWEYTRMLSDDGIVILHDTNAHPGPYFLMEGVDTDVFDAYKYLSDIWDYGVGVLVKKPVAADPARTNSNSAGDAR